MRMTRSLAVTAVAVLVSVGSARLSLLPGITPASVHAATATPKVAVGPQYATTHVYVTPENFDPFVASLLATFGGTTSKQGVFTVTPTPSSTMQQLVLTPVGIVSVFGFKTPVPYPFGARADRLSGDRHGCGNPRRSGHRRGCPGHAVQRSDRSRCHHSMARRRGDTALLAYDRAVLSAAPDHSGKSHLCVSRTGWPRSLAVSLPSLMAKSSPTMRMRLASRSGGRLTPIGESASNRTSASSPCS